MWASACVFGGGRGRPAVHERVGGCGGEAPTMHERVGGCGGEAPAVHTIGGCVGRVAHAGEACIHRLCICRW